MTPIKVKVIEKIAAYQKSNGNVLNEFETFEEGMKTKYHSNSIVIGPVWVLRTENDECLDDAKGCYLTKGEALNHLKNMKHSHSSEPTDTEGHSYDCKHCGLHYDVFYEGKLPVCTVEKTVLIQEL